MAITQNRQFITIAVKGMFPNNYPSEKDASCSYTTAEHFTNFSLESTSDFEPGVRVRPPKTGSFDDDIIINERQDQSEGENGRRFPLN